MTKKFVLRERFLAVIAAVAVAFAGLAPVVMFSGVAHASEQLTSRKVTIDKPGTTETDVEYLFEFTLPSATNAIQGVRILFCTTPLGTCTTPTGFSAASYTYDSISSWTNSTNFTQQASDLNDCTSGTNPAREVCLIRTQAATEGADNKIIQLSGFTHTSMTANTSIYERITLYDNNTFTPGVGSANIKYDGVVASNIVQTLTIAARVQENLMFCVGTTTVNDGTTSPGADCSAITGTTVDLGIVDTTTTGAVSPDSDGNNVNGIAFLRTNANGGTAVGYKAVAQSGTNHTTALRVLGASCNAGDVNNDQCFRSYAGEHTLGAASEQFGMAIPFVNTGSGGSTTAITRAADYDYDSADEYAWQENNTSTESVATASGPVDDEALILKFAAVAAITTPTGSYQAQAKFIATPTF